jgi:hypothetical protein
MSSKFTVYLFYAPDCRRNWLAYTGPSHARHATLHVEVEEVSGTKAKNKAITLANRGFVGLKITHKNYFNKVFGLVNYPDLLEVLGNFESDFNID